MPPFLTIFPSRLMVDILIQFPWAPTLILLPLAAALICFLSPQGAKITGLAIALLITLAVSGLGWQLLQGASWLPPP